MIPRRLFWLADILVMGLAFGATYVVFPALRAWVLGSGLLAYPVFQILSPLPGPPAPLADRLWVLLVLAPLTLFWLEVTGNYRPLLRQSRARVVVGGLLAPFGALSVVALALLAIADTPPARLFLFSYTVTSAVLLTGYRLLLRVYYARRQAAGYYIKNVALAGPTESLEWMARYLAAPPAAEEHRVVGYLRLSASAPAPELDAPDLGLVGNLGQLLIQRPIHEVIAVVPSVGGEWLRQMVQDCDYFRVGLRVVPEALLTMGEPHDLRVLYHAEPLQLPAVVLQPPGINSEALFFKRLFDMVVAAVLLLALAPLLALIALAIKLTTPGLPVLYGWRVAGFKGVEFTGYKFTTMWADADARKAELLHRNEMTGPVFKLKDDPRVTPLGRFLRKYSLDELPQLWSVLKGDMSLVGPRPAFPHELVRFEMWQKRKLSVRPGMTCLWQVRGRNRITNFDDWVRLDLYYIEHWSLWLDFKILVWTALAVVKGTGS
jgi:exopolysaccharide biosynthesis polyprenyl glycosylphosphotransferase